MKTTYKKNMVRLSAELKEAEVPNYNGGRVIDVELAEMYLKMKQDLKDIEQILNTVYKFNDLEPIQKKMAGNNKVEQILNCEIDKVKQKLNYETNLNKKSVYYKCCYMMQDFIDNYNSMPKR